LYASIAASFMPCSMKARAWDHPSQN
jgi:hypothetical protein